MGPATAYQQSNQELVTSVLQILSRFMHDIPKITTTIDLPGRKQTRIDIPGSVFAVWVRTPLTITIEKIGELEFLVSFSPAPAGGMALLQAPVESLKVTPDEIYVTLSGMIPDITVAIK